MSIHLSIDLDGHYVNDPPPLTIVLLFFVSPPLQRRLNVNRINSAVIVINLTKPIVYRPITNVI